MSSLFKNDNLKNDLLNGILEVQKNFTNKESLGINDIFDKVSWGKMSEKQIKLVTARLRELEQQGMLTQVSVNGIAESFEGMASSNFLKTLGSTVKDFALNFAVSAGLSVAISLVVGLIGKLAELHKTQEELIQDGQEAQQTIKSAYDEFQRGQQSLNSLGSQFADQTKSIENTGDAIDVIAQKYHDLSQGVNSANENIGLSNDEYKDYLSISNQLAEQMPSLVEGYDAQGNAILNLSDDARVATEELKELYNAQTLTTHVEIGEKLGTAFKGYTAKTKQLKKENKQIDGQIKKLNESATVASVSTGKLSYNMSALGDNAGKFRQEIRKTLSSMNIDFTENDVDASGRGLFSLGTMNEKQVAKVQSVINKYAKQYKDFETKKLLEIGVDKQQLLQKQKANELLMKETWNGMVGSLRSYLQTSDTFSGLSNDLQEAFLGNLKNVDASVISEEYGGDVEQFLYSEFIEPLSGLKDNKKHQELLANLFKIDPSSINLGEYQKLINEVFDRIFPNDKKLQQQMKSKLGFDKVVNETIDKLNTLSEKYGDSVNQFSLDELNKGYDLIVNDKFSGTFEEFNQKIKTAQALAATEIDLKANTNFNAIDKAGETPNAGDDYVKAQTYLKETKEALDKGLIGTDDFKTKAAYFSPTGADDPVNFAENYAKAARYLTEDSSGVINFLNDLTTKTNDSGEALATFDSNTQSWKYNINDLEEAARDMGIGFEFMLDIFGRLEDYGFSNNFVGSIQEGNARITDKAKELANAKAELARLESSGDYTTLDENGNEQHTLGDQTAIDQMREKVKSLQNDITETRAAMTQLTARSASEYAEQQKAAKETITAMVEERNKVLADRSLYGEDTDAIAAAMEEDIRKIAAENNLELDAELNLVNPAQEKEKIKKEIGKLELEVQTSDTNTLVRKAQGSLKTVQDIVSKYSTVELSFSNQTFESVDRQILAVKWALQSLANEDGTIDLKTEGAQECLDVLDALFAKKNELSNGVIMNVDVNTQDIDSDLNYAITLLQEFQKAASELEQYNLLKAAGVQVDTTEAQQKVQELAGKISGLGETTKAKLGIDDTEIQTAIDNLEKQPIDIPAGLELDQNAIDSIRNAISSITQEDLQIIGVEVKGQPETEALTGAIDNVKGKEVNVVAKASGKKEVDDLAESIRNIPISKTSTITKKTVYETETKTPKGGNSAAGVNGTAHAFGSAYAGGNWGLKKNLDHALVGELGTEILVRDGRYYTIGDNGAEFVGGLKKGDIIFNHKQSEELLKKGYVTSGGGRGKAYANGTAGNAYAGGTGGGRFHFGLTNSSKPSYTSNLANKAAQAVEKAASTASSALDKLGNLFDWVAIKLDKMAQATDRATKKIELAIGLNNKQQANADAINAIQKEISANRSAYDTYIKQANTIASSLGLSQDLINKVQNGAYSIADYDEDTNKKIGEYQKWYDLAQKCLTAITDLEQKEKDLAKQRLDNIVEYYDAIAKLNEAKQEVNNSDNELKNAYGESNISASYKQNIKDNIKIQEQTLKDLVQKLSDYQAEFNNLMAKGYIKEGSDAWYEAQTTIQELTSEINKTDIALVEFQEQLQEIKYKESQYLIDGLSRVIDKISNVISLNDKRGKLGNIKDYQNKIDKNNSKIQEIYNLRNKKLEEMKYYDVTSDKYQQLAEEISKLDSEIFGLLEDNEELAASIREIRWTPFNKGIESLEDLTSEAESLKGLLNEEAFFDKSGQITSDGLAYIALTAQQMKHQQQIVSDYTEGLKKLDEELANGTLSTEEYQEEQKKFLEAIREGVSNVEDYKNQIIDLYKQQMEAEVDALDKVIDKRKEAHEQKVRYEEYDKKVRQQNKEVLSLEAQIRALDGVTNAYALAEKKRLEAQLASAKEDLDSTRNDHKNDMISQGFDEMSEDMHELLDDTLYELTHNANKQQEVVSNMLNNVVNMYKDAYGKIQGIIGSTGFVPSAGMNQNISGLGTQQGAAGQMQITPQGSVKPSQNASGVVTGNPIKNPIIDKIETDISTPIDTSNRKVAELTISPVSMNLIEGQSGTINFKIRPSDAANKQLDWKSSNPTVADVNSSGIVSAKKAGSATISVSTIDGSGISKQCAVSVAKKPEPPKPAPKPNTPNKGGGDGVPNVGDAVIYKKGSYYYDSQGVSPSGYQMLGQTVYISQINRKSWATKPYHITRDKAGRRALGWVSLDQISGYKHGIENIPYNQLAEIDENNKRELVYRHNGHNYSVLTKGSGVIPATPTKNLMAFGNDPQKFLQDQMKNISNIKTMANINLNVGNMMNIEKVTPDTVPSLESLVPKLTEAISKELMGEINKLM